MDSRRYFLKKAAMLAGEASLSSIMPSAIAKTLTINPAPGSTFYDAKHVVLLMQENRSFDLSEQTNWYDFRIKCVGFDSFEEQYAGRIEAGQSGKTDPLLNR